MKHPDGSLETTPCRTGARRSLARRALGGRRRAGTLWGPNQANPQPSPQRKGRPYCYKHKGPKGKRAVLALVERGGRVRSFHIANASKVNVNELVNANIARET